jgi:hypothetical protein
MSVLRVTDTQPQDAQGFANLYRDERYIAEHGFGDSKLLEPIIDCIVDDGAGMDKFLPRLATYLVRIAIGPTLWGTKLRLGSEPNRLFSLRPTDHELFGRIFCR